MAERKDQSGQSGAPREHAIHRTRPDAPLEPKTGEILTEDEKLDEAARESMGTSDPPSHTPTHAGKPKRKRTNDAKSRTAK